MESTPKKKSSENFAPPADANEKGDFFKVSTIKIKPLENVVYTMNKAHTKKIVKFHIKKKLYYTFKKCCKDFSAQFIDFEYYL